MAFTASGVRDADPTGNNMASFTIENDNPTLSQPVGRGQEGSLTIKDGHTVPHNLFSVGVGVGGKAVYAVNAGPNSQHIFTPSPAYWVCATENVEEGEVIDISTLTQKVRFTFPPNVFSMTATFNKDGTWEIKTV